MYSQFMMHGQKNIKLIPGSRFLLGKLTVVQLFKNSDSYGSR